MRKFLLLSVEILGGAFVCLAILIHLLPASDNPLTARLLGPARPLKTATTQVWHKGYRQPVKLMIYPNDAFCIAYPKDQAMFCGYFDGSEER